MAVHQSPVVPPMDLGSSTERAWLAGAAALLLIAAAFAGAFIKQGPNFVVVVLLLTVLVILVGKITTGRLLGALINERNLMSLSRFQMIVWTIVIVSAFLTIAIVRVKSGEVAEPLDIEIDWPIWALLGMSVTSLVGTPLINGNKKNKKPRDPGQANKTAVNLSESADDVKSHSVGVLYGNRSIVDARFTDLFEGDELVNAQFLDVAKLQMFFFTAVIAIVYAAQIYQLVANNVLTDDVSLPTLNQGLLALLGVSHAGYLGAKGITSTPSES